MRGNTTHRFSNTTILDVSSADASQVVTSAEIDDRLADTYQRVRLRPGMLERLVGIRERRWWPDGVTFVDGAAMAGAKAISESGIDPAEIGLMVNTSVSREHLEPSTATAVHHALGLPSSCQNFDLTNACLGFVNGIELAGAMIDSGRVDYVLVVNGEDSRKVQERTIENLSRPGVTSKDVMSQFASLTLGSGAAAMVLGRADRHPEGHQVVRLAGEGERHRRRADVAAVGERAGHPCRVDAQPLADGVGVHLGHLVDHVAVHPAAPVELLRGVGPQVDRQGEPGLEQPLEVGLHEVVVADAQPVVLGAGAADRRHDAVALRVPVGAA